MSEVENNPVMFVGTCGVTAEQVAAALAAMQGEFTKNDVAAALIRAGVPPLYEPNRRNSGYFVADRAADRLLQKERKAGRVGAFAGRRWVVLSARSLRQEV